MGNDELEAIAVEPELASPAQVAEMARALLSARRRFAALERMARRGKR